MKKLAAEQLAQYFDRQKEIVACSHPVFSVGRETAAGDHAVQVRMKHQVLSPRVQHRGEADVGPQMSFIGGNLAQGGGSGGE